MSIASWNMKNIPEGELHAIYIAIICVVNDMHDLLNVTV